METVDDFEVDHKDELLFLTIGAVLFNLFKHVINCSALKVKKTGKRYVEVGAYVVCMDH
jgi:hypothetical protein